MKLQEAPPSAGISLLSTMSAVWRDIPWISICCSVLEGLGIINTSLCLFSLMNDSKAKFPFIKRTGRRAVTKSLFCKYKLKYTAFLDLYLLLSGCVCEFFHSDISELKHIRYMLLKPIFPTPCGLFADHTPDWKSCSVSSPQMLHSKYLFTAAKEHFRNNNRAHSVSFLLW